MLFEMGLFQYSHTGITFQHNNSLKNKIFSFFCAGIRGPSMRIIQCQNNEENSFFTTMLKTFSRFTAVTITFLHFHPLPVKISIRRIKDKLQSTPEIYNKSIFRFSKNSKIRIYGRKLNFTDFSNSISGQTGSRIEKSSFTCACN